jgi:hypothetical protein
MKSKPPPPDKLPGKIKYRPPRGKKFELPAATEKPAARRAGR